MEIYESTFMTVYGAYLVFFGIYWGIAYAIKFTR